jgi:response regulator of citrate/malate metabolism
MTLKNFNILVVEDVVLMSNFLCGVVNRMPGCSAFKALDYKTATEVLATEAIDLLVTDIELKNGSGIDLLSSLRSGTFSQTAYDIPIIVLSVNAYKELIQQCILFDVNDFFVKPVSAVQLAKKLQQHIQKVKFIQPVSYYEELMQKLAEPQNAKEGGKRSVAIVLDLKQKDVESEQKLAVTNEVVEKRDFLYWPDGATTNYFQLDRRLKNLAFTISFFYDVFINNGKLIAIDTARNRACASADYLIHITKNMQQLDQNPEFWNALKLALEKLQRIMIDVDAVNIKHTNQVLALLKKLAYWWMQTCNRPLIHRVDDVDDNPNK